LSREGREGREGSEGSARRVQWDLGLSASVLICHSEERERRSNPAVSMSSKKQGIGDRTSPPSPLREKPFRDSIQPQSSQRSQSEFTEPNQELPFFISELCELCGKDRLPFKNPHRRISPFAGSPATSVTWIWFTVLKCSWSANCHTIFLSRVISKKSGCSPICP
jgi:hypothetical protein